MTKHYYFEETCRACPEQYDVFDEDNHIVAYVRLRWGILRVDVPDCGGETIYSYHFDDDMKGCFDSEKERDKFLEIVENKIHSYYNNKEGEENDG